MLIYTSQFNINKMKEGGEEECMLTFQIDEQEQTEVEDEKRVSS